MEMNPLISRRALNLLDALRHDRQLALDDAARTAAHNHSIESLGGWTGSTTVVGEFLGEGLREIEALHVKCGNELPLGTAIYLARGDRDAARELRLVLHADGWHADALDDVRAASKTLLRLPNGAGFLVDFDSSGALRLAPLPFDDALTWGRIAMEALRRDA